MTAAISSSSWSAASTAPARTCAAPLITAATSSPRTRRSSPSAGTSCSSRRRSTRCASDSRPASGAIPIVRALTRGLAGDRVREVSGILNGTCNYILTRMEQDDLDFDAALRLAQERGFAEADPTLDVSGQDAAQKLRILAEIAFGRGDLRARVHGIA